MRRRELLLGVGALALGCSRRDRAPEATTPAVGVPPPPPPVATVMDAAPPRSVKTLTWTFDERGPTGQAVVLVPDWGGPDARFPVLIALHGRGEAIKPPAEGAMGWPRDYALTRAIERVCAPPITEQDLEGFVEDDQVAVVNRRLEERPFAGLIVACPYLPDLNLRSSVDAAEYARFLVGSLLPRVRRETPALATAESTGIDGVSLGGATAMRVGLTNTDTFGAIGALQPAITDDQTREWTELARAALAKRPALKLRLTTSHEDYYRVAINRVSAAWRAANVAHDFAELPGPHDYPFNRGPGAIEMLLWHDRVLAHA